MRPVRLLLHIEEKRSRTLLENGIIHSQKKNELLFLVTSSLLGLENIILSRSGILSPPRSEKFAWCLGALIPQALISLKWKSLSSGSTVQIRAEPYLALTSLGVFEEPSLYITVSRFVRIADRYE